MNTNSRTSHRLAASVFATAVVAGFAATAPAAGTSHPNDDAACSFDPAYLPQTADAVDGWYDQCRAQQHVATDLPRTADAVQGWYVQRRTGQHILITSSRPPTEATETPPADRPANWRRLMDEVPESPQDLQRVRVAFERGVGPGRSLYSAEGQG